ncbi:MAG: hypothetical protein IPL46_35585 [Saprospiraceae bacterium]|nr:hypothetical protein [Saprospiraceae bacterium]
MRKHIDQDFYFNSTGDPMINMVMGKSGPIWYRNLAREHDGRPKDSQEQLESVLNYYEVDRMIIGHTVMPDICADYQGKLIKIDILHGQSKNTGYTKGILAENNQIYKVDDLGNKERL